MKHKSNFDQELVSAHALEQQGRIPQAEAIYRQIVANDPGNHGAWHALGILAFNQGNPTVALQYIEAAIAINGKVALYHRNIGEMYRRVGQLEKSVRAGQHAVRLAATDFDAHYNLGLAYTDAKDYGKAIECYRKALKLNSRHNPSWNNLGSALEQQGHKSAALEAYERAIAIDPRHAEAQNNAGAIYSELGRLDDARRAFCAAIDAKPDFVEAHRNLSSLKKYTVGDPHLAMLEGIYAHRAELSGQARIRCCFALGKALDDVGDYDRAFAAYEEGNRLQHALLPMDEGRADTMLRQIIEKFDEKFFVERSDWRDIADQSRTPIFIVGMPRSGTTLLEQILCSHASVYGAGELSDLNDVATKAIKATADKPFPADVTLLSKDDMRKLGEGYLKRVWKLSPDSRYITDKMPANFFYLGLIHLALPHAKIIHASRDPMDSCFSCYTRLFNDTMDFAYDQGTLGRYYARYMRLMEHWHRVLPPGTILDLAYEDMVEDPEGQARRVLEFVGLPWDSKVLDFHENKRLVKTASVAQVREPIYKTSVARWKHFARHLQPLWEIVRDFRKTDDIPSDLPSPGLSAGNQELELAARHQSAGHLQEAEVLLRQILATEPKHANALNLLGVVAWQSGRVETALDLVAQAISLQDDVALFHCNRGEMCRQVGRIEEAIRHGRKAVETGPAMAVAHGNLGVALFDAALYDDAEACHRRALEIEPGLVQSLNNMGSIARARGDRKAAANWYRKALDVHPDYLESLSNLGAVLVEEDCAEEAQRYLERALQLSPTYAEGLCNLGLARLQLNNTEQADVLLQRALHAKPGYPEALVGLARVRREQDRFKDAETLLRQANEADPANVSNLCLLGLVLTELGKADEAEATYRHALALDPQSAEARTGLGNLLLEAGDIDGAEVLLREAVAAAPDNIAVRFHLVQAKKVRPGDENLAALEALAEDAGGFSSDKRISLHFALGKAYDDLKEFDKAFPHFLEGNRLKRAKFNFDVAADEVRSQRVAEIMNATFVERLSGAGNDSTVPVFVLGMPRSGTTLTEQIIVSHPEVFGAGELPHLLDIVQQPTGLGAVLPYPENLAGLTRETLTAWGDQYVAQLIRRAPSARRITDKMPANYLALGLIPLMLPQAKIIHVVRNPVDTCVSCFTRLFNLHQHATYDLAELGRHYVAYTRLMAHWKVLLPGRFLEVHYEDIVANMEGEARRLIDFCGLEWNDACLSFHETKRNVRTASLTQVRQPIYGTSVERWRHYEKFLGPLLDTLAFAP